MAVSVPNLLENREDIFYYDIRVKSPNPLSCLHESGERLYDPPHMEREVGRKPHESAECGRSVGARSAKRSGYQVLTPISFYCN